MKKRNLALAILSIAVFSGLTGCNSGAGANGGTSQNPVTRIIHKFRSLSNEMRLFSS